MRSSAERRPDQYREEAGPKMEKIRKELENLEETEKKISRDLEALEVEKNAPSRVDILSKAKVYPPPVIGRKETMMGMGGVGSFFLVLLGFAYLGFRAQRVDSRDQIVQTLGINFIGSVPDFSYRPGLKFLKSRQQEEMVRDRMILDSVDAVRTMLLSRAKEEQLKVVMVTSALGGEGKTSTAGHLATSLARVGQKTLLIDCDLRNPHIHRLFNVSRGPGMSEVLHGKNDCMEVIQPSFTDSLSILSAGDFSTQTLQYFSGEKILEIIQKLKSQYDFIIVDSSPILFVPEAQILSQCSDGVILSVMRNVSRLPKVHSACDLLERLCARNLGFIINGVSDQTYLSSSYYYLPSP